MFSSHFRENTKIDENRENIIDVDYLGNGVQLGLKQRCIFQFSRKCKNYAKMERFSRNITKFCLAKIFVFAKFSQKSHEIFRKLSQKQKKSIKFGSDTACMVHAV
jgi:hypothetical protein